MIIRATITLTDTTTRERDFETEESAQAWFEEVRTSGVYGDASELTFGTADVTAQVEQEQADSSAIARGLAKQEVGAKAIAMLNQVHEEMNLDAAGLGALAADQNLMLAVTLVRNGAIKTGRDIFQAAGRAHYTPEQIARIVRPINDSGLV